MPKDNDSRFEQVLNDPRFRTLKKKDRNVKIDSRFKGMFTEKRFRQQNKIDRRGNRIAQDRAPDLKAYYDVEKEPAEEDDKKQKDEEVQEEQAKSASEIEPTSSKIKKPLLNARGEISTDEELLSSSSDEGSSDEDEDDLDHKWGELDKDAPRQDGAQGSRLAICNIDWDRIKAVDLYVLVNSFKPESAAIKSIAIYKSEFGKQRIAEEEKAGPTELVQQSKVKRSGGDEEDDESSAFITEQLRKYQLNRLKYFYAVVDCDSADTALALYDELDGFEYESSASTLDVRVIPDDVQFDDEPDDICTALPNAAAYAAPQFVTTALQQSKVDLTWDEDDPRRKQKLETAFKHAEKGIEDDISAYLASSGSEESDSEVVDKLSSIKSSDKSQQLNKYKELLKKLDESDEDDENNEGNMEMTWTDKDDEAMRKAMDEESASGSEGEDDESETDEPHGTKAKGSNAKAIKEQDSDEEQQDNELDLLVDDDEGKSHFNYKNFIKDGKKKKSKKAEDDDFEINVEDPRFAAMYSSHLFNVDQSDPHFKRTAAMEKILDKKRKHHESNKQQQPTSDSPSSSLNTLISTVKEKSRLFKKSKRQ